MRGRKLIATATALAIAAPALAGPLPVHVGGRVVEAEAGSKRFGWPGTYFEGRFRGTAVTVEAESGTEHMRLLIDGAERAVLVEPGRARLTIEALPPGEHVVRLEKLTESQSGGGRFIGFFIDDDATALPPLPRARRIEFIGDSHSVGYGNMSPVRACPGDGVHDTTNTQRAFGPLVARRFDADYRINAYSGFGIVRNYDGGARELSLPIIYPRGIPGEPATAPADGWRPDLIVINLGTNDFSTPLKEGERWGNQSELRADYRQRYGQFLRGLMKDQPQARFILMGSDAFFGDVAQIVAGLPDPLKQRVSTLQFGGLDLGACDWHPSLADHEKLAKEVAAAAASLIPEWKADQGSTATD